MISRLSAAERIIGWLACNAIKALRVSDAEWQSLCADGSVSPKMAALVSDYRIVRECERVAGGDE